ncbi:hypothetical protein ACFFSH_18350 [Streptomyces filamentosus]|uniref:Uncharacterized protein n=1 Tax=Streptomyces filamentosus TaxID=67294 RepID=A0A919BIX1_STRFL|nr:hypothetical protein [Streptomyces filamentosus]GHF92367.1 hypothetical protein GCM10017667_22420 [Streptomyces filamentosus]
MSPGDEHDGYGGSGQTRTRLPEGNTGDVHGGTRRPARSSRSLLAGLGVVALLVAAIAFANRGGTPAGTSPSSDTPGKAATAPTGTRPVTDTDGTVPTGYAHDEQGAQSAAANYAVALGSTDMFQKGPREALVRAVYAPEVVDGLLKRYDASYSPELMAATGLEPNGTAPDGLTFVARTVPIGTKVTSYSADKATVDVWYVNLTGLAGEGSTKPVTSAWFTSTQKLSWTTAGWRISSTSQAEGPTPVGGDDRASAADEIAEAVEQYGGFTYAR